MRNSLSTLLASSAVVFAAASCGSSDDAAPQTSGSLSGTVVNAPTPVSGVRVVLTGAGGTFVTTTTANGGYDLTGIPTGTYTVDIYGDTVFDSDGNPIPSKIDLHLPNVVVTEGTGPIGGKSIFLPQKDDGTTLDTAGGNTATIPAGTVLSSSTAGVSISFDEETIVTFQDSQNSTVSITEVPVEHTPAVLPSSIASAAIFAIEPAGATFDVRPTITFPNSVNLPVGAGGVRLFSIDYASGNWTQFGTGTVSVDGSTIVSDIDQGMTATGWHAVAVDPFCATTVAGRVTDTFGAGVENAQVTTVGGLSSMTDANGDFSIENVILPTSNFPVQVTALPQSNSGFVPDESGTMMARCGATTEMGSIILGSETVDTMAPTVSMTTPVDGATAVADNGTITVLFSEIMSPGSFGDSAITATSNGVAISGTIGFESNLGQTTVTFLPNELLPTDATVQFTIDGNVSDSAGNVLGQSTSISFDTEVTSTGGTPSIVIMPSMPADMDPSDTAQFTAMVLDASNSEVDGALVQWSSDAPAILDVNATGLVTARTAGSANVTASFGGISQMVSIVVTAPVVDTVTLSAGQPTIAIGSSFAMTATARDSGNNPLSGLQFDWSSSDDSIATVSASGIVRGVGAGGPVTITATERISNENAGFAVTVIDPNTVDSVSITASSTMLGTGSSVQYSAMAFDSGQTAVPGVTFTWTSSAPNVASVNANGLVTGTGTGMATITAVANGGSGADDAIDVTSINDTPLVITVLGGPTGTEPQQGVTVLRNSAVTGQFIEEIFTNVNGVADFGLTQTERATVTIIDDSNAFELHTFYDVAAGMYSFTIGHSDYSGGFSASVSAPSGSTGATAHFGAVYDSESVEGYFTKGLFDMGFIETQDLQADGRASYVFTSRDESQGDGEPTAAAFFLDVDTNDDAGGFSESFTLDTNNIASVSFSAEESVTPGDTTMRRSGLLFDISNGQPEPSASGNVYTALPPGADKLAFQFESGPTANGAFRSKSMVTDVTATSLNVSMPDLEMTAPELSGKGINLSWSASGTDAAGLDLGVLNLEYLPNFNTRGFSEPIRWNFFMDGQRTSMSVPQLPNGFGYLAPNEDSMQVNLDLAGIDAVTGFDGILAAARPYAMNLEQFLVDATTEVEMVGHGSIAAVARISGTGDVVLSYGSTTIDMQDNIPVTVPVGEFVTVTSTAVSGEIVQPYFSNVGTTSGVGTQVVTTTFTANESAEFNVNFVGAP